MDLFLGLDRSLLLHVLALRFGLFDEPVRNLLRRFHRLLILLLFQKKIEKSRARAHDKGDGRTDDSRNDRGHHQIA